MRFWVIYVCVLVGFMGLCAWSSPARRNSKTCKEIVGQAIAKHIEEYHESDTYPRQRQFKFKVNWDELDAAIEQAIEEMK